MNLGYFYKFIYKFIILFLLAQIKYKPNEREVIRSESRTK